VSEIERLIQWMTGNETTNGTWTANGAFFSILASETVLSFLPCPWSVVILSFLTLLPLLVLLVLRL
jgi:hypothetical protein